MEGLIDALKAEDAVNRRRARKAMVFFGIAAVIYCAIFILTWILPPDGNAEVSRVALALFTAIFFAVWIKSRKVWRELSAKDYSAPVTAFVEEIERRYRFIDPADLLPTVAFLLLVTIGTGTALVGAGARYLPGVPASAILTIFGIFWSLVLLAALLFARAEWKKRKAPLWQELKRLKEDFTMEESDAHEPASPLPDGRAR